MDWVGKEMTGSKRGREGEESKVVLDKVERGSLNIYRGSVSDIFYDLCKYGVSPMS